MQIIRGSERPFVPASHEDPARPGVWKRVLATHDDLLAGRVQMLNWARLPQGSSFQAHYHEDMQEIFVIINGQVTVRVDDKESLLCGGDAILIQPREVHTMCNACDEDVHYIVLGITTGQQGKTIVVACPS